MGRVPGETDRRRTSVCVTDKVARYVEDMDLGPSARLTAALGTATAEQRRTIRDGLTLLRQLLAD